MIIWGIVWGAVLGLLWPGSASAINIFMGAVLGGFAGKTAATAMRAELEAAVKEPASFRPRARREPAPQVLR